jgi:hypothetical protein
MVRTNILWDPTLALVELPAKGTCNLLRFSERGKKKDFSGGQGKEGGSVDLGKVLHRLV